MAQVSKIPLNQKVKERILEIFFDSIAELKTKEAVEGFFSDFLSPTERTMLAKRLSIAVMIAKGFDYRTISNVLKVSSATVTKVGLWYKELGKNYKIVVAKILKDEKIEKFWHEIGKAFRFLEFSKGRDWLVLKRKHWLEDQEVKKPF